MGNVLTKTVRDAWERYCGDRPGEDHPDLLGLTQGAKQIERPSNLNGDHLRAYQHPEYKSFYFVVAINEDEEKVFMGIRNMPRAKAPEKPGVKKIESKVLEWDPIPEGLEDQKMIEWCLSQNVIALGRMASGECNSVQGNARLQQIAIIRSQTGMRMANPQPKDPLRKVKDRNDFERGQDRERGDIINFLKEKYTGTPERVITDLINGEHRKPR